MTKTFIIQHAESGDYDYSEYASTEAAWDAEKCETWVETATEEGGKTLEECRKEFVDTLAEYTEEEVLTAHKYGHSWPKSLGLIDFCGEETEAGNQACFIGYTVGLECFIGGRIKMVKCEYSRTTKGVKIAAVSGHNLSHLGREKTISQEVFANRKTDVYDSTVEAIWALEQIGLIPAALEE